MTPSISDNRNNTEEVQQKNTECTGIIPVERNLTENALWLPQEKRKVFEGRTVTRQFSDERSRGYSVKIRIKADIDLGTLTTYDQRVFYCLIELWLEQGKPDKAFFSLRQLSRMLDVKSNIKPIRESLIRLRGVLIDWNGAFYDFSCNRHIHITNPFTVLSHLSIASTKDKAIRNKIGEFSFDEHIIKNFLHNGTRPINRLVVQSFKTPTAQLLYTLLDRELYGTNEYSRLTAGLFQDLGLTAKRWQYLSNRVEALKTWQKEIRDKATGYGETINYFEIEPSKGKDSKLVVRRTGAKRIQKIIDLSPETHLREIAPPNSPVKPRRKKKTPQSIPTPSQPPSRLKTAKSSQKEDAPKLNPLPVSPPPESSELEQFIELFKKQFLASKPQFTQSVMEQIEDFIKQHSGKSLEFLSYCKQLTEDDNFAALKNAQTPAYLFKSRRAGQTLIERWLESKRLKSNTQQVKLVSNDCEIQSAWIDLERHFKSEYEEYLLNQTKNLTEEQQQLFEDINEQKEQEYLATLDHLTARLLNNSVVKQQRKTERLIAYGKQLGYKLLNIREWIKEYKPDAIDAKILNL